MIGVIEEFVRGRAENRCEYCHAEQRHYPERFQMDHIIARQHGGSSDPSNLALACLTCNLHKGPNIASIDPQSGEMVSLYDPRKDVWNEHFIWRREVLDGITPVGHATVRLLMMNAPHHLVVRQALIEENVFPPKMDNQDQAKQPSPS